MSGLGASVFAKATPDRSTPPDDPFGCASFGSSPFGFASFDSASFDYAQDYAGQAGQAGQDGAPSRGQMSEVQAKNKKARLRRVKFKVYPPQAAPKETRDSRDQDSELRDPPEVHPHAKSDQGFKKK